MQRGDTLSGIAQRFGVTTGDLRRWNHLDSNRILVGHWLDVSKSGGQGHSADRESSANRGPAQSRYRVRRGDTLSEIAERFRVSVRDLRRWNHLHSDQVRIGQTLEVSEPSRRHVSARSRARAAQLRHAFVASSKLRPMAQQLAAHRTRSAYAGVLQYARTHSGEASAAAYMALGQAYLNDGKYDKATDAFQSARRAGKDLDDYADYLEAQTDFAQKKYLPAGQLLRNFSQRHPDSVLVDRATLLQAEVQLGLGDPQNALREFAKLEGSGLTHSTEYLFALGKANQLAGNRQIAQQIYTRIYVDYPTSAEASQVGSQLQQMGIQGPFTVSQSMQHARGLYEARDYSGAEKEYGTLEKTDGISAALKNELRARAALAAYKRTGSVSSSQLAALSDTNDEAGAIRLYLSMEQARDGNDAGKVQSTIEEMERRFPTNEWTAHALMSAGNMALLVNDFPTAVRYYRELANRFPRSSMAPLAHWHAAWLTYRSGDKKLAALLFDEQIARYSDDARVSGALYWRGIIYESEKKPAVAAAYYKTLSDTYPHYYYADLARQRLAALGKIVPATVSSLSKIDDPPVPDLTAEIPDDDIHVERARLLANAGLNQYIAAELDSSPDSASWRALAEAQIYSSDGENWRAMQVLKRKVRSYLSAPIDSIPRAYWELLFPRPYWTTLEKDAKAQGLDPYLVASLIRQETEFDPKAISYANAWGLMQLLPSVGKELARKEHLHGYRTSSLLNPDVNLHLGTAHFRQLMNEFNNEPAYAAAAYNAGSNRVHAWLANGPYASLPEFVESIPFTQTREYVEAVLRNRELYKQLYGSSK